MNGFRDMEVYDMEHALRLFCDTSTRSFLYEVWSAFQRIKVLKEQLDEASAGFARRGDLISELNNSVQALERLSEDRLMRVKKLERELELSEGEIDNHWYKREEELEQRVHELETLYDDLDREYKASLEALEFEQGLACEQAQTIADRNEDVRKLKMQIIELEHRNERLNTIVEAKRGVGQ